MKILITELFHIQYPIICSGMTGVSRPSLQAQKNTKKWYHQNFEIIGDDCNGNTP